MKARLRKYRLELTGVVAGATAGWCYWYFVGCASGHCAITSRPLNSAAYGAVMGGLLFSMLRRDTVQKKN